MHSKKVLVMISQFMQSMKILENAQMKLPFRSLPASVRADFFMVVDFIGFSWPFWYFPSHARKFKL